MRLAKITLAENKNSYKCISRTMYIVLIIVVFTIFTGITIYFVYYNWSLIKNNVSCIKFGTHKETKTWQTYKWEKSDKLTLKIEPIIFRMIKLV